jgi:hypothetical protein
MAHEMSLYSLVIEHEGKSYTTQVEAQSEREALVLYLATIYPATAKDAFGPGAPVLAVEDIIYVTPMQGLVNLWAISVGRAGRYLSAVCALTVPGHAS